MRAVYVICLFALVLSCRTTSKPGLFSKKTPHEIYGNRISEAGLQSTALGKSWFSAAANAISQPLTITKPYKETGFFAAGSPSATGLRFAATRGEKIQVTVSKKPAAGFKLYLDLWRQDTTRGSAPQLIASSDTTGIAIQHEVDKSGYYVLRLQPELLQDCEYTIDISAVAALAFPVRARGKNLIKSYWGADRDAGARRHEGIDIFAAKRTPVVAAADGRVTRVNENNLGGKVVWMRPEKRDYTLYYAHLDTQLVQEGQQVQVGDTLGLMGNTGNARTTPPHLHFGIYSFGGAIDPLPFVNPDYPVAPEVKADLELVGKRSRAIDKSNSLRLLPSGKSTSLFQVPKNTLLEVESAVADFYRVRLPDGRRGYINTGSVSRVSPIRRLKISSETPVYALPDTLSPVKKRLSGNLPVEQLAEFGDYHFVNAGENVTGWIRKPG
jgi:peptidoglycan LD-endopeptidase LytH